ncbi:MAG TPA: polysaccharide deacetylase family protein [Thermoleophilaceae bacterium]
MADRSLNLTFHGIGDPARALDPGEDQVWIGRDRFLAVLDTLGRRSDVRLTFDDGNGSDVTEALPELSRRELRATFFPVAGRLEVPGFLGNDGVLALVDAGMAIGCHGMCHRAWRQLSDGELREELVDAKEMLEALLGRPVTEAACPFGSYDRRVLKALRLAGYTRVYTSDGGTSPSGAWLQARNTVTERSRPDPTAETLARAPLHAAIGRQARLAVKRWR